MKKHVSTFVSKMRDMCHDVLEIYTLVLANADKLVSAFT